MIVCCGEALIDMIPMSTECGEGFIPLSGGSVLNTAVALGRLRVETGMVTGLSSDIFGRQLSQTLEDSHVNTAHVITSNRPTTLAFVQLNDGQASYSFFDENSAGRMLEPKDMPYLPDEVSTLFFGGISLACEPGAKAYLALLEREARDRAVMLDPNIRQSFIEDEQIYRERLNSMMQLADIVKLSDEDLDWIAPKGFSIKEKIGWVLEKGPALVVLTQGEKGATGYLANGGKAKVSAERVKTVDTVGAGDTFNAGLLAKLSDIGMLQKSKLKALTEASLIQVLAFGTKVAAVTVGRAGANSPWADELS